MSEPENVIDTESGIRRCNAELQNLDKLQAATEQADFEKQETKIKTLVTIANGKTFWSKELQGYLRLAEQQGKGKHKASDLATTPKKRVKLPEGIEVNNDLSTPQV